MNLGSRVAVVVVLGGVKASQFDGLDSGRASGIQPLPAGQQGGWISGRQKPLTQCDCRKGVAGSGPATTATRIALPCHSDWLGW